MPDTNRRLFVCPRCRMTYVVTEQLEPDEHEQTCERCGTALPDEAAGWWLHYERDFTKRSNR